MTRDQTHNCPLLSGCIDWPDNVLADDAMYQAPELPGTYEITATASADAAAHGRIAA